MELAAASVVHLVSSSYPLPIHENYIIEAGKRKSL